MDGESEQDFVVKLWSHREESYERPDHSYQLEIGKGGIKIPFPNSFLLSGELAYDNQVKRFTSELEVHDSRNARLCISYLALREFDDLLAEYARKHYIAFDVYPCFFVSEGPHKMMSLRHIIDEVGVDCQLLDDDLVRISKPEYAKLIRFPHIDFHLLDPTEEDGDELRRMCEAARRYDFKEPMLGKLESPRVYIDSHDDDSVWLEARDLSFLRQVFERTLQTYVGTHWLRIYDQRPEISWVPEEVMEHILPSGSAFTTFCENHLIRGDTLIMHYSDTFFAGPRDRYKFNYAGTVEYDFGTGEWTLPPKRL
ncbi:MAG: hypothetical protein KAW39_03170 [Thermoplasmata archaeon]|nr:hypothetical protein [Thermoplasmata archaeon]